MAAKAKYYTIIAGNHQPQPALQGVLEKTTGLPKGEEIQIMLTVGRIQIPNWSEVWGKRVIEGKDEKDDVSVTDKDYRGEIKFLPYGAAGGEAIEVRWLPNSKSLDKQYQDTVLKLKLRDEHVLIDLEQGLNDFDEATQGTLIQMLRVHGRNGDSVSRNPDIREQDYREYNPEKMKTSKAEKLQRLTTAMTMVFETEGKDSKIEIMASIQGLDAAKQSEILFNDLLTKAEKDPVTFLKVYQDYKKRVKELMDNSIELKLLDDGVDGLLSYFVKQKKEVLISNIPATYPGKRMLVYVTDNILDSEIHSAIGKLKSAYELAMKKV